MQIEFENAPACCRKSVERITDIYSATGCLQEFLAAAPSIVKPTVNVSAFGAIWKLGTGLWSWRTARKSTSKLLAPIVQNRVGQVIDFELIHHANEPDLLRQWSQVRKELL